MLHHSLYRIVRLAELSKLPFMKYALMYLMAILYIAAGIYHFIKPRMYCKIIPPWLPNPLTLVYFTGVLEIVLGVLLIPAATRNLAAWGLVVLLILIFPANIQMTINYRRRRHPAFWLTVLRLPLQLLLIYWAWTYIA